MSSLYYNCSENLKKDFKYYEINKRQTSIMVEWLKKMKILFLGISAIFVRNDILYNYDIF